MIITIVDKRTGREGRKSGTVRRKLFICAFCKAIFKAKPYREAKFCSHACYAQHKKGLSVVQSITVEERNNRKLRMTGENNPMWRGGDSDKERRNAEYKLWRIKVFERDGFTCQLCGYYHGIKVKRRDLNAHHIVKWIDSLELRYAVENGITLCVPCHIKEHTNLA